MVKRFGTIFFLVAFLVFSFSGTICTLGKLSSQQVSELLGNIAEEEDEAGTEDCADSEEAVLEMFESVSALHIQIEHAYLSHPVDPLPDIEATIFTPPPQA
jgi:hypothetical protein